MAGAMMEAQFRPDVKAHKAAIQDFIPSHDPESEFRKVEAKWQQLDTFAKIGTSILDAYVKIDASKQENARMAATAGIKEDMAIWYTERAQNMDIQNADGTLPSETFQDEYAAKLEELTAKHRSIHQFSKGDEEAKFGISLAGLNQTYEPKIIALKADHNQKIASRDADITMGKTQNTGEAWDVANTNFKNGTWSWEKADAEYTSRAKELTNRDMAYSFQDSITFDDVVANKARYLNDGTLTQIHGPDGLLDSVDKLGDEAAENVIAGVLQNQLDRPVDALQFLDGVDMMDTGETGFSDVTKQRAVIQKYRKQINAQITRMKTEQKAIAKDQETTHNLALLQNGGGHGVSTPSMPTGKKAQEAIDFGMSQTAELIQEKNPDMPAHQVLATTRELLRPALENSDQLPTHDKAILDRGSNQGASIQEVRDGLRTYLHMQDISMQSVEGYKENEFYDQLIVEIGKDRLKNPSFWSEPDAVGHVQRAVENVKEMRGMSDTEKAKNSKDWTMYKSLNGGPQIIEQQTEKIIANLGWEDDYSKSFLKSPEGMRMQMDMASRIDTLMGVYGPHQIDKVTAIVQGQVAREYALVREAGRNLIMRDTPESEFLIITNNTKEREAAIEEMQLQRSQILTSNGLSMKDYQFKSVGLDPTDGRMRFVIQKVDGSIFTPPGAVMAPTYKFRDPRLVMLSPEDGAATAALEFDAVKVEMEGILRGQGHEVGLAQWRGPNGQPMGERDAKVKMYDTLLAEIGRKAVHENWGPMKVKLAKAKAFRYMQVQHELTREEWEDAKFGRATLPPRVKQFQLENQDEVYGP